MAAKKKVWRDRKVYERWLERREREGWSFSELARRSRIPESSLQRWSRRLRSRVAEEDFVEVVPALTPATSSTVEIVLRGGRRIIIPIGTPPEQLLPLVSMLESC